MRSRSEYSARVEITTESCRTMKGATTIVPKVFTVVMFLVAISVLSHGQDFSADVVYLPGSSPSPMGNGSSQEAVPTPKVYVSKGNVRLETNGLVGTVLVVN